MTIRRKFKTFDLHDDNVYRNKAGHYVQQRYRQRRPALVKFIAKMEISPEKRSDEHTVCSTGRSAVDGKWYGWSHRAIVGFGQGDKVFEEDFGTDAGICKACNEFDPCEGPPCLSSLKFIERGTRTIETDADAREAAYNFAAYIS